MEHSDGGCVLTRVAFESYEEFKLPVISNGKVDWKKLDKYFKWDNNKTDYKFFVHRTTPVFIANFNGVSSTQINTIIDFCNNNSDLPYCHKEMLQVQWYRLDDKSMLLSNANIQVSSFANSIIDKVNQMFISFLN